MSDTGYHRQSHTKGQREQALGAETHPAHGTPSSCMSKLCRIPAIVLLFVVVAGCGVIAALRFPAASGYSLVISAAESCLLVCSLGCFYIVRKQCKAANRNHTNEATKETFQKDGCLRKTVMLLQVLCFLCAVVTPVFNALGTTVCIKTEHEVNDILDLVLNVLEVTFLVCQLLALLFAKIVPFKRCGVLFITLICTNACLCVRCLFEAAKQTVQNYRADTAYTKVFCKDQPDTVSKGYRITDMYFYMFVYLFCLYFVYVLCVRSKTSVRSASPVVPDTSEDVLQERRRDTGDPENLPLLQYCAPPPRGLLYTTIVHTIGCAHFVITFILILVFFTAHVYLDAKGDVFKTLPQNSTIQKDTAFNTAQSVFVCLMGGAAFLGAIIIWREKLKWNNIYFKHLLLAFGALFHFILVLFEILDNFQNFRIHGLSGDVVFFSIKTFFHVVGTVCQTWFIIKMQSVWILGLNLKYVILQALLWFLALSNLERAIVDIVLTPNVIRYATMIQDDDFGILFWRLATRLLFPTVVFFRIQSFCLCFENLQTIRNRKTMFETQRRHSNNAINAGTRNSYV